MTAKEYLTQAANIQLLIEAKERELIKLRAKSESLSSQLLGNKVQTSKINTAMYISDKIIDLERYIEEENKRLINIIAEIHRSIECVYNPLLIAVLTDKYLNFMTLEAIAEKMNKSYRTICVWHDQALEIFRKETGMR